MLWLATLCWAVAIHHFILKQFSNSQLGNGPPSFHFKIQVIRLAYLFKHSILKPIRLITYN